MKNLAILILSVFIFTTSSADTTKVKNKFFSSLESFLNDNFANTEFSVRDSENENIEVGILTFKPLIDNEDNLTFFQGSFFTHDSDRETINLGLGKRSFYFDDSFMFGLNAFYDQELDYDHKRGSLGTEVKSSIFEFTTNHYLGMSETQNGKNNVREDVADGYDMEIGAHIPYIPSARIYAKLFEYDIGGSNDFEGIEYTSNIGIPNTGMNFEVGYRDFGNNSYEDKWVFNFTFNFNKINPNSSFITNEAYNKISMKDKKYDKVRRENIIVKKKGFSVKAGGF